MVLTVNGKAAVVVQDAESYQQLLERVERLEVMAGIRQSMDEFDQGKGMPLEQAFQQLQQKHDIPDWDFTNGCGWCWADFSVAERTVGWFSLSLGAGMLRGDAEAGAVSQSLCIWQWKSSNEVTDTAITFQKVLSNFVYSARKNLAAQTLKGLCKFTGSYVHPKSD